MTAPPETRYRVYRVGACGGKHLLAFAETAAAASGYAIAAGLALGTDVRVEAIGAYEVAVCSSCGAFLDPADPTCLTCAEVLAADIAELAAAPGVRMTSGERAA